MGDTINGPTPPSASGTLLNIRRDDFGNILAFWLADVSGTFSAGDTLSWTNGGGSGSGVVGSLTSNPQPGDNRPYECVNTHPATVQEGWLHVPEWAFEWDNIVDHPENKSWGSHVSDVPYRYCCTGSFWKVEVLMAYALGIDRQLCFPALFDYVARYNLLQPIFSAAGVSPDFHQDLWDEHLSSFAPEFACVARYGEGSGSLRFTFNRYATMNPDDTGITTDSEPTLGEWEQVEPCVWATKITGATMGWMLRYVRPDQPVVDAGNNELPEFSGLKVTRPYRWEESPRPYGPTQTFGRR